MKLTQITKNIETTKITGQIFLYDTRFFDEQTLAAQSKFWEDYVRREKSAKTGLGRFHEEFIRQVLSMANFQVEYRWWRQQRAGKLKYNITLSNSREIDRVLETQFKTASFAATILFPIEAKFIKGGVRPEHVQQFYNKLRGSNEFGDEVELHEQKQTFRVRILKAYVTPLLITPYITESARKLARTLGVTVIPTWRLEKLAGEKLRQRIRIKILFKNFMKSDLSARDFLKEAFRKR